MAVRRRRRNDGRDEAHERAAQLYYIYRLIRALQARKEGGVSERLMTHCLCPDVCHLALEDHDDLITRACPSVVDGTAEAVVATAAITSDTISDAAAVGGMSMGTSHLKLSAANACAEGPQSVRPCVVLVCLPWRLGHVELPRGSGVFSHVATVEDRVRQPAPEQISTHIARSV
jgi:hypothetical protein